MLQKLNGPYLIRDQIKYQIQEYIDISLLLAKIIKVAKKLRTLKTLLTNLERVAKYTIF